MKEFSGVSADAFARRVSTLYMAMETKFGDERAWEFILAFYKGAGSD